MVRLVSMWLWQGCADVCDSMSQWRIHRSEWLVVTANIHSLARASLTGTGGGGGLSEEVVVPAEAVLPLPDQLDLDIGGDYDGTTNHLSSLIPLQHLSSHLL